jgi:hypothetical protein
MRIAYMVKTFLYYSHNNNNINKFNFTWTLYIIYHCWYTVLLILFKQTIGYACLIKSFSWIPNGLILKIGFHLSHSCYLLFNVIMVNFIMWLIWLWASLDF